MSDFLLELYSNALPYKEQSRAEQGYYKIFTEGFEEQNINYEKIEVFSTPCRITIFVKDIKSKVKIESEVVKGPKVGCDSKALEGFCRSQGLDDENFLFKTLVGSVWYWIHRTKEHYKDVKDVLLVILPRLIFAYDWNDYLYSGENYNIKWPRFLKNILCIIDSKTLKLSIFGLKANNITFGHQFLSNKSTEITNFKDYRQFLANNYVLLSREDRRKKIIDDANEILRQHGFKLYLDRELLEIIIGCFEYPQVMLGKFPMKYLKLPKEIIEVVLKNHQRYFSVYQGKTLQNYFLYITNNFKNNSEKVRHGYQNALVARLDDAEFLLKQDLVDSLEDRLISLKDIIFHTKLGTMWDKSHRLVNLVKKVKCFYQEHIPDFESIDFDKLKTAALYFKCDLTSALVDEFPSLKGYMGHYLALQSGLCDEVANYIKYQYSIDVESANLNKYLYLGLLDNIDSLVGMYVAGEKVTGNYDRYGMRRLALKIIRIMRNIDIEIPFNLFTLIDASVKLYHGTEIPEKNYVEDSDNLSDKVIDFIKVRHNNLLKLEKDYNPYIVESVFNSSLLIDNNFSASYATNTGYDIKMADIHLKNIFYLTSDKCHKMFEAFVLSFRRIDNLISGKNVIDAQQFRNLSIELENLSHELELNLKNSLADYQAKYPMSWKTESVIDGGIPAFHEMCEKIMYILHDVNILLDMLKVNMTDLHALRRAKLVSIVLDELKKIADFSRLYNLSE